MTLTLPNKSAAEMWTFFTMGSQVQNLVRDVPDKACFSTSDTWNAKMNQENKKSDVMTYLVDGKVCVQEGDNLQLVKGLCHEMSVNH